MKLQSMTDFVLSKEEALKNYEKIHYYGEGLDIALEMVKYANFLKQPLEIWMFIPCGDDGDILENPSCNTSCDPSDFSEDGKCGINGCYAQEKNYQKAKERCLFDIPIELETLKFHLQQKRTIEYFTAFDVPLTQSAIIQIGK